MNYFAIVTTENLVEQVVTASDNSEELKTQYESIFGKQCIETVSYTHLTLPTNREV